MLKKVVLVIEEILFIGYKVVSKNINVIDI